MSVIAPNGRPEIRQILVTKLLIRISSSYQATRQPRVILYDTATPAGWLGGSGRRSGRVPGLEAQRRRGLASYVQPACAL